MKNFSNSHMSVIVTLALLLCAFAQAASAEEAQKQQQAQEQKMIDNTCLIVELDKTARGFESSECSLFRLIDSIDIFDKETNFFNDIPGRQIGYYALAWNVVHMSGNRYTQPTIVYPKKLKRILSPGKYLLRIANISDLYVKDKDIYLNINLGEMTTVTVKQYDKISVKTTDLQGNMIKSKRYQANEGPRGRSDSFYQIKID